ncbi:conserved hypothetical protein [Neospora caninum Liverpool]|nr:conserved hypothetical protein [Neospora caninum Liverpool]CBZ55203.1 conserved hypothetical protein [Neospora caninum Liverpool]|eukprot:XP_003885231.1 conserved hypothetical protein [Neospora caninum Liverpool]
MSDAGSWDAPCGGCCWRLSCRELQHADLYHGAAVWCRVPAQRRPARTEGSGGETPFRQLAGNAQVGPTLERTAVEQTAEGADARTAPAKVAGEDSRRKETRNHDENDEDEQVFFMPRVLEAICRSDVPCTHEERGAEGDGQTGEGQGDGAGGKQGRTDEGNGMQMLPALCSGAQSDDIEGKVQAPRRGCSLGTLGDETGELEGTGKEGEVHDQAGEWQGISQSTPNQDRCQSMSVDAGSTVAPQEAAALSESCPPGSGPSLPPFESSSGTSASSSSVSSSAASASDSFASPGLASFLTPSSSCVSPSSSRAYLSCSSPCCSSSLPSPSPSCFPSPTAASTAQDAVQGSCLSETKRRKVGNEESSSSLPSPPPRSSSDPTTQSSAFTSAASASATATRLRETMQRKGSEPSQGHANRVYILPMARGEWVRVDSAIWFRVLRGTAEIRGHLFPPSRDFRLVSSPLWSPTVRILAVGAPGAASARLRKACAKTKETRCREAKWQKGGGQSGAPPNAQEASKVSPPPAEAKDVKAKQLAASSAGSTPHTGREHAGVAADSGRCRCACSPLEQQFVDFTGGDAEAVSNLFTASIDSLPRRFLTGARPGHAISSSANSVGPALRRLLQVDEKLGSEVIPSTEIGEALKRFSRKRYPVVLCFAQFETPGGPVAIHSALEPPAPACIYRPLEILPPSWRYVAYELLRIFASGGEQPALFPLFSASRPGVKWFCSTCLSDLSERPSECFTEGSYRQCAKGQRRLPAAVLWGGKGAGKTTFSLFLLNFLLNFFPRVAYLEADVGQPTFTLPGCVSLLEVREPVLTPPHMLVDTLEVSALQRPARNRLDAQPVDGGGAKNRLLENLFFGDVSPKSAPHLYLRCVSRCISTYCECTLQSRRSSSSRLLSVSPSASSLADSFESSPGAVAAAASPPLSLSAALASAGSSTSASGLAGASPLGSPPASPRAGAQLTPASSVSAVEAGAPETPTRQNVWKRMQGDGDVAAFARVVPLIVNTPGWIEGLGEHLLSSIQAMSKASACIQFLDSPKRDEDAAELAAARAEAPIDKEPERGEAHRADGVKREEGSEGGANEFGKEKRTEGKRRDESAASRNDCGVARDRGDASVRRRIPKRQRGGDRNEDGEREANLTPRDELQDSDAVHWTKRVREGEGGRGDLESVENGEAQVEQTARMLGRMSPSLRNRPSSGGPSVSETCADGERTGGTQRSERRAMASCEAVERRNKETRTRDAADSVRGGRQEASDGSQSRKGPDSSPAANTKDLTCSYPMSPSRCLSTRASSSPRTSPASSFSSASPSFSSPSTQGCQLSPSAGELASGLPPSFPACLQRLCSRTFPGVFSHRVLVHPLRSVSRPSSLSGRLSPLSSLLQRTEAPRLVACPYVHGAQVENGGDGKQAGQERGDSVSPQGGICRTAKGKRKNVSSSDVRVCECCGQPSERTGTAGEQKAVSNGRQERMQETPEDASRGVKGDIDEPRQRAGRGGSTEGPFSKRSRVTLPEILAGVQRERYPDASPLAAHPLFQAVDAANECECGVHIFSLPTFKQHLSYMQAPLAPASPVLSSSASSVLSYCYPFAPSQRGAALESKASPPPSSSGISSSNTLVNLKTGRRYRRVYDEIVSESSEAGEEENAPPTVYSVGRIDGETEETAARSANNERAQNARDANGETEMEWSEQDTETASGLKPESEGKRVQKGGPEAEKEEKLTARDKAMTRAVGGKGEDVCGEEGQQESGELIGERETTEERHEDADETADFSENRDVTERERDAPERKLEEAGGEAVAALTKERASAKEEQAERTQEALEGETDEGREMEEENAKKTEEALHWRKRDGFNTVRWQAPAGAMTNGPVSQVPLASVSPCPFWCCSSSLSPVLSRLPSSRPASSSPSPPPACASSTFCSCCAPSYSPCGDPFERPPAPSPAELRWLRLVTHFVPCSRFLLYRDGLRRFSWEGLCSFFLTFQEDVEWGSRGERETRSAAGFPSPAREDEQDRHGRLRGGAEKAKDAAPGEQEQDDVHRAAGTQEAKACLSGVRVLSSSCLFPLARHGGAPVPSFDSASAPAGRCQGETRKRYAHELALPRPTARKWIWVSLAKIRLALRECDWLAMQCEDECRGVRDHVCSTSTTEKILSCLPTMTVALAISAERERKLQNSKHSDDPAVSSSGVRSLGDVSSHRARGKTCRLKIVETTEDFTCVCYAVVMRVHRRSQRLLCLVGGSTFLLGDLLKRVDTVMLG